MQTAGRPALVLQNAAVHYERHRPEQTTLYRLVQQHAAACSPSCGARRMAQTAAHLVDHVIPHVPVCQWVLSLPIPLRVLSLVEAPAPTDEALQAVLHKIITRTLKLLTRLGVSVEEEGLTYMADNDGDSTRPARSGRCRPRRVPIASHSAHEPGRRCSSSRHPGATALRTS